MIIRISYKYVECDSVIILIAPFINERFEYKKEVHCTCIKKRWLKLISYSRTVTVTTMTEKHTIYFAGRITGGRKYADLYQRIVEKLKTYGNVLTEHVANPTVEAGEIKFRIFFKVIESIQSIWLKYGSCGLILFYFRRWRQRGINWRFYTW